MFSLSHATVRSARSRTPLVFPVALSLLLGSPAWATGSFKTEGAQYSPAGSPIGDQLAPALAIRSTGGCLVWQDNSTDGDGFGIGARRLTGQLTGFSSLRVNENGVGDQENPQVAILANGSNLIIWQSGVRGAQQIVGRILKSDGQFAGPEFLISGAGTDHREPALAVGSDGGVLVVWEVDGVDGNLLAVESRRLASDGSPMEAPVVVNQYTAYHQRSPAVAALTGGGFVVAWVSEHQRFENSVDVYSRTVQADGNFAGPEALVNNSQRPCATPSLVGLANGGYAAAWAEHDSSIPGAVWDVYYRTYGTAGATSSASRLNTRQEGLQSSPKLAASGDDILAVYRSDGGDGAGFGVVGQWFSASGQLVNDEFVVNTKTAGDQLTPTVVSDGGGRMIAAWSTYGGVARGLDLAAQRFTRSDVPLNAPGAPYVFAASSSRLIVTWPELAGLSVTKYELFVDGSDAALLASSNQYVITGLAPASQHLVTIRYTLADGRKSPASAAAIGKTWGEDENADGLPDDWESQYFGNNPAQWPLPNEDTDHDGVTNREEFLAGTDPTSAASVLLTRLESNSQGSILHWNTRPGAFYQVQSSANLKTWQDVGSPRLAPGSTDSLPVSDVADPSYFRVNLLR